MQLTFVSGFTPKDVSSPSSQLSADGAIFYSAFGALNGVYGTYVFRLFNGAVTLVTPNPLPTARGILQIDADRNLYLTAWMVGATALHRIPIPGYVPFAAVTGTGLTDRYKVALERLCAWLGIP